MSTRLWEERLGFKKRKYVENSSKDRQPKHPKRSASGDRSLICPWNRRNVGHAVGRARGRALTPASGPCTGRDSAVCQPENPLQGGRASRRSWPRRPRAAALLPGSGPGLRPWFTAPATHRPASPRWSLPRSGRGLRAGASARPAHPQAEPAPSAKAGSADCPRGRADSSAAAVVLKPPGVREPRGRAAVCHS